MGVDENIQLVKEAYAAFGRGDIQALLGMLTDDVEWITPGQGVPLAGTYRGRDGVAGFFQKLSQESAFEIFEPREFIGQGDRVVVLGFDKGTIKSTNRIFASDWAMTFTIRNGKVSRFQEYIDTQAIAAAYGLMAKAAG